MKIRTAFVSNSSSSSFICRKKMTIDEAKEKTQAILECYNKLFDRELKYENVFFPPYKGSKKYDEELKSWGYIGEDKNNKWDVFEENRIQVKTTVGRIVIDSESDNSIPYELFELIEEAFDAIRLHLG